MKPFAVGLYVFLEAIYLLDLQHQTGLSKHILALVNWTRCAHYTENIVLIKPARLLTISVCLNVSVEAAVTHPPRFFLISLTFFPSPLASNKKRHWNPLTCHLGGCVGQPPIQMPFFFPTGGLKEERCGRISCERPFLYVSHTIACLFVEGRLSGHRGWQEKSLCTCSPTQTLASGDYRKWHTN